MFTVLSQSSENDFTLRFFVLIRPMSGAQRIRYFCSDFLRVLDKNSKEFPALQGYKSTDRDTKICTTPS
jgi:hypothetical protein